METFGTIRCKLDELLEARGWTVYRLWKESGLRQDLLGTYRNNTFKNIVPAHVATMCAALNCGVGELLEYVPGKPKAKAKASGAAKKR